jgi:hypothetical protein
MEGCDDDGVARKCRLASRAEVRNEMQVVLSRWGEFDGAMRDEQTDISTERSMSLCILIDKVRALI